MYRVQKHLHGLFHGIWPCHYYPLPSKKPNNKSNAKKNWQKEKCRTNTDNAHCTQAQNANNIFITLHDLLCIASKINKLCCLTQRIPKTIPYHLHLHRVNKRFCLVVRIVAVVVWLRYNLVCRLSFLLYKCILCLRVEIRESNAHQTIDTRQMREHPLKTTIYISHLHSCKHIQIYK